MCQYANSARLTTYSAVLQLYLLATLCAVVLQVYFSRRGRRRNVVVQLEIRSSAGHLPRSSKQLEEGVLPQQPQECTSSPSATEDEGSGIGGRRGGSPRIQLHLQA